jgi:hypothetical protein
MATELNSRGSSNIDVHEKTHAIIRVGPTSKGFRRFKNLGIETKLIALFVEKAANEPQQLDAGGLGHVVVASGSPRLLLVPFHRNGAHGNNGRRLRSGSTLICRVAS